MKEFLLGVKELLEHHFPRIDILDTRDLAYKFCSLSLTNDLNGEEKDLIIEELKRAREEALRKPNKKEQVLFNAEAEREKRRLQEEAEKEALQNNLLPEIELSKDELYSFRNVRIRDLNWSSRLKNTILRMSIGTLRELFKLSRSEIAWFRAMGPHGLLELGEKLEEFLNLPEDRSPKGSVRELFKGVKRGIRKP